MFKAIFGLIFKFRDFLQKKFGDLFEKFRDPETGKITFARPKTLKLIVGISSLIIFFLILISQIITSKDYVGNGMEAFEKELKPTTGVNSREINQQGSLEEDPFKGLNAITRDEFGNVSQIGGTGVTGIENSVSLADCVVVIDKMKSNQKLSVEEESLAGQCIKENPMGLTENELKMAKAMIDPTTTDAEKELLSKVLANKATSEELAVANALVSGDKEKEALAKSAIEKGSEAINVLGKSLDNMPLTEEEKKLLDKIKEDAKTPLEKVGDVIKKEVLSGINEQDLPKAIADVSKDLNLPNEQSNAIKELANDLTNRENVIKNLEDALSKEQLSVSPIAEKLASGKQLDQNETKRLQSFTKQKQQLESLKKLQDSRKDEFSKRASLLQNSVAQAITSVQRSIPTGTFIEYEGDPLDCRKIKPIKKKKLITQIKKENVLDLDGRPLKPEEVEFIKLHRKNQYEVSKLQKDIIKGPMEDLGNLGQQVNIAGLAGEGGQVGIQDLQSLIVFKDSALKSFELTPDMKIAAVLDSEILVSDKGKGQQVRMRILADVHNPQTNQIVISKGSIVVGSTSSFDADTGIMDLVVEKAVIGSGKTVAVRLAVGSADGTMGLKGQVRDTTGKYLAGAFVTAFSAGALGWFSQQIIAPFQSSTAGGQALTGAGLAGSAEVLTKLSELYSSKLQNAAVVFWVPKGIPVVLFPQ